MAIEWVDEFEFPFQRSHLHLIPSHEALLYVPKVV